MLTTTINHDADFASLEKLLASGQFHHATYRNHGTVWEGLWFYRKSDGFRGFSVAGCIHKGSPYSEQAYQLVRCTGVSTGSYGR